MIEKRIIEHVIGCVIERVRYIYEEYEYIASKISILFRGIVYHGRKVSQCFQNIESIHFALS